MRTPSLFKPVNADQKDQLVSTTVTEEERLVLTACCIVARLGMGAGRRVREARPALRTSPFMVFEVVCKFVAARHIAV